MSLQQQVFTNAGITMLGHANAGQLLTITKIVVGQGTAASDADIYPLTSLIAKTFDVAITRKTDLGNGIMLVSGILDESKITGTPFQLRELGIMAQVGTLGGGKNVGAHIPSDPGGGQVAGATGSGADVIGATGGPSPVPLIITDLLYCASNVYASTPDTVTPGGTSTHAFDITVVIDRATNITVVIGDQSTVDCQNIPADATVGPGVYAKREGNIFDFKRLVEGYGIDMTEQPDRIIIGLKTLAQNLDLYVPTSNPQAPDPSVAFPSVQAAHDYLLGFIIPPSKTATIHVGANALTTAVPINITHPNASQISLLGMPRVDVTFTSLTYVNSTTKRVVVTNATGLFVGQIVYLAGTTTYWMGGCTITAIAGTTITLSALKRDAQPDVTGGDSGTGRRLSYFPSSLINSDNNAYVSCVPVIYCPNGIGTIENLLFVGRGYLVQMTAGTLKNTQIMGLGAGAKRGTNCYGDLISLLGENVVSNCDEGIISLTLIIGLEHTFVNACGFGISVSIGGFGALIGNVPTALVQCAHCTYGIYAGIGSNFQGGSIFIACCDYGMAATIHSVLFIGQATNPNVMAANGIDLYAQGLSYIQYDRRTGPDPTCNPPATKPPQPPNPDIVGNQQSLIYVLNGASP